MKLLPAHLSYKTEIEQPGYGDKAAQHYYSAASAAANDLHYLLHLLSMIDTENLNEKFDIDEVAETMRGIGRLGATIADILASDIEAFADCYRILREAKEKRGGQE